jgi:methionyl-tRNA formyltransferase
MIIFGDILGINLLLQTIDLNQVKAIVGASIRPQYLKGLQSISDEIDVPFIIQPKATELEYDNFIKKIEALKPDLFFINSYSMILKKDLLSIPKKTLNIHAGLLPKNRGCNPIQWGIINEDKYAGVSLHEVDEGIDTGAIIDQRKTLIKINDTWVSINERINSLISEIIKENLEKIVNNQWISQLQDDTKAHYNRRRKPEDGLFDWSLPTIAIYNLVRALIDPLPGAFYVLNNKKIELKNFKAIEEILHLKYINHKASFFTATNNLFQPTLSNDLNETAHSLNPKLPTFKILFKNSFKGSFSLSNVNWNDKTAHIKVNCEDDKKQIVMMEIRKFMKQEFQLKIA